MVVKNEEAYMNEFVDYGRALGINHFYIYDNTDLFVLKQWGRLKGDDVDVRHYIGERPQMKVYSDCFKRVNETGMYEWVAFFDADEFLVLKEHDHIADMLEMYCARGALTVNWRMFSDNCWNTYVPEPITRRFLYGKMNEHVKTIARVKDVQSIKVKSTPHNFVVLKDGMKPRDTNGEDVDGPDRSTRDIQPKVPSSIIIRISRQESTC